MDKRQLEDTLCDGRKLMINPDVIGDFRNIPYEDNSFKLVIFDPPHLKRRRKFMGGQEVWKVKHSWPLI